MASKKKAKKRVVQSHPKTDTIPKAAIKKALKAVIAKRASVKRKPAERIKLAKKILDYMVTGNGHSASASCRHVGVATPTFLDWVADDQNLAERYDRNHRAMVEMMADETKDIADDGSNDYMENLNSEGVCVGYKLNGEHVQRSKLRVDTRKWLLSKIAQKKYGDKIQLGGDEDNPLLVVLSKNDSEL